ncbi:hypothetical protein [Micromonospora chersina]|uniref:hypothetical protein n=1 Tax=Micromonospora chersina TaxID=47854 RepID=UPI00370F9F3A
MERIEPWWTKLTDLETMFPVRRGLPPYSCYRVLLTTGRRLVAASPTVTLSEDVAARGAFERVRDAAERLVEKLPTRYVNFAKMRRL